MQDFIDDTVDNSDESDIIEVERAMAAKSFDKAVQYARKELNLSISSLSELPLKTLNCINSLIHRLYQEIPVLNGVISEIVLNDITEIAKASVLLSDSSKLQVRSKN